MARHGIHHKRGKTLEILVRESIPVNDNWVGAGLAGESRRSYELRQELIRTQRDALDKLDGNFPAHMKVSWRVRLLDQSEWEWNPQVGVPEGATHLVFVVAGA